MDDWGDDVDAIIMAWYPGMEGGNAMGDLIFGDINFSGRTIQTWPKAESDLPEFGNTQAETEFLYYHGYRHFDHYDIEPLFPFGFGLSYTTFEYEDLQVPCARISPEGHLNISVEVRNAGDREGVEVVQVYVAYPNTKVRRPERELKGFARVELAAGETKSVNITIPLRDLAYYDSDLKKWVVEELEHRVEVGPNARTLPLSASFEVGGGLE
jgi:beta-glucosidase